MPLVSVAGQNAFDVQFLSPRVGAWQVDGRVDDPDGLSGQVAIVLAEGARTLRGSVMPSRSGVYATTTQLRVLAGAGALGATAAPRGYANGPSLGMVLSDLLGGVGEQLSPTSDAGTLATVLPFWHTSARPVGAVLAELMASAAPQAGWRFLDDGTFWVGPETWPDSGLSAPDDYVVLDRSYEDGWVTIWCDRPLDLVGKTFEGGRVSVTQADVPHTGRVEMTVWFEDAAAAPLGRVADDLAALVRATPPGIDHLARYSAVVVAQSGGIVDVRPLDPRLDEQSSVPLRNASGDSIDGTVGGTVLLGWEGGDASKPYAIGFDADATPNTRTIAVLTQLLLGGPEASAFPALVGSLHQASEATMVAALIAAFSGIATTCHTTVALTPIAAGFDAVVAALTAFQTAAQAANNFLSTKVDLAP